MNDAVIGLIATFFDLAAAVGFFLVTQLQYLYYGKNGLENLYKDSTIK